MQTITTIETTEIRTLSMNEIDDVSGAGMKEVIEAGIAIWKKLTDGGTTPTPPTGGGKTVNVRCSNCTVVIN